MVMRKQGHADSIGKVRGKRARVMRLWGGGRNDHARAVDESTETGYGSVSSGKTHHHSLCMFRLLGTAWRQAVAPPRASMGAGRATNGSNSVRQLFWRSTVGSGSL